MGYQVGRICYFTKDEAVNEVMTHVVPTIDKDGVLHHPVFNGKTWEYNNQTVKLTFPECNPMEYKDYGERIGKSMVGVFIVIFMVVIVNKIILWQRERNEE